MDTKKVLKQWLETDAAFGVTDIPIPAPKRSPKKSPIPATAPPSQPPRHEIPRTIQPLRQPPTPPAQPAPRPVPRPAATPAASPSPTPRKIPMPPIPAGNIPNLPPLTRPQKIALLQKLAAETQAACQPYLSDIATRVVFGEGDPDAPILFIGEGPGAEEDKSGRPFVGRSGQLLDKMIAAIGYQRDQVYIANVVKLRCADFDESNNNRPKDRPPTPEEAARALPILHQQIEIIRPKVIVTLGAPAIKHLTGATEGVTKLRGHWLTYRGLPVMPTLHPSYVLRLYTPENRRNVWSDLKLAAEKAKT